MDTCSTFAFAGYGEGKGNGQETEMVKYGLKIARKQDGKQVGMTGLALSEHDSD